MPERTGMAGPDSPPQAAPAERSTVHATAVLVGARAVLIRGPAGSGKSTLALRLLHPAGTGPIRFARLVGDDRVYAEAVQGVLLVRPPAVLAGLIEVRGLGLRRLPFEPVAAVGGVVDLAAADAVRLPDPSGSTVVLCGIRLPRLAVAQAVDPLVPLLAFLGDPDRWPAPAQAPI